MRRQLASTTLALVALPSLVAAQVRVGGSVGLSIANVSVEEEDFSSRTGLNVGGFVSIPLGETFSVHPGLTYTQKGAENGGDAGDLALKIDYLQIPLLGVFHIPSDGPVAAHVFAGPTLAFEVSCELAGGSEGVSASVDCDSDLADFARKSVDFGAAVGAAVSYAISETRSLFLAASYNLGLTDLNDDPEFTDSIKNRAFSIDAGFTIQVGS